MLHTSVCTDLPLSPESSVINFSRVTLIIICVYIIICMSVLFTAESCRVRGSSHFLFCNKLLIFTCIIFHLRFISKPCDRSVNQVLTLPGSREAPAGLAPGLVWPGCCARPPPSAPSCCCIFLRFIPLFWSPPSGSFENGWREVHFLWSLQTFLGCSYCSGACLGSLLLQSKRALIPQGCG